MIHCNRQNHSESLNITYSARSGVPIDNWAYFKVINPAVVTWDYLINTIKLLTQQTSSNFYCSHMFRPSKVTTSLTFSTAYKEIYKIALAKSEISYLQLNQVSFSM
jgi:hypothetical protein